MKNPPVFTLPESALTIRPGLFESNDCDTDEDIQPSCEIAVDKEALFRTIIKEYGNSLYYFVLKRVGHVDDAAEIAQQTFVEAACSLTSYRGEAEFSTWIFGIAANLARNHVSRAPQRRHHFESELVLDGCESPELQPCENLSQRQGLELVSEAISRMPPEMAQALKLVAVEEMSYREAAEELNVPVGTVRSRVSRARAAVRAHLLNAGYLPAAAAAA
jgi:RNA polymerase sigma-70 factor (ECF subfamily)